MRFERHSTMTRKHDGRGFTLIELLVAIVAGLLVAAAAISFSKQSTRFFSQEARIAAAQMSVLAGFQRLQSDLSRASYMSTPNMRRDLDNDRICAPNVANWSPALQKLTGLLVTPGGSDTAPAMPDGQRPDTVRIAGSLSSSEVFPVRTIMAGTVGHDVYLQVNTGALTRSGINTADALKAVFKPGRVLRIVDQQRKQEYEIIASTSFENGQPIVKTKGPLPLKGDLTSGTATTAPCGIEGFAVGVQANVVEVVEYGIANLTGHDLYKQTIYSDAGYALGDDSRTELARRELFVGEDDPGWMDINTEIVAEYAVDLRLGLWATNPGGGMVYIAPSSAGIATRMTVDASYVPGVGPSGPESVRSVEVRLVVRSREVDRREDVDPAVLDGGFIFRYPVSTHGFARARTLIADVTLPNQGGESW